LRFVDTDAPVENQSKAGAAAVGDQAIIMNSLILMGNSAKRHLRQSVANALACERLTAAADS
jgi:hypothetical protein